MFLETNYCRDDDMGKLADHALQVAKIWDSSVPGHCVNAVAAYYGRCIYARCLVLLC